jgi:curli biogenesis system outer membrane secretion channel CsgG
MQKRYLIPVLAGMLLFVLAAYAAPPPGAAEDSQAAQTRVLDVTEYIKTTGCYSAKSTVCTIRMFRLSLSRTVHSTGLSCIHPGFGSAA